MRYPQVVIRLIFILIKRLGVKKGVLVKRYFVLTILLFDAFTLAGHLEQKLVTAVYLDDTAKVEKLIKMGVDLRVRDNHGYTALANAVLHNNFEMAELLLKANAQCNVVDADKRTPLMLAAHRGYLRIVQLLLQFGAEPNIRDADGRNALVFATQRDNDGVAELLFDYLDQVADKEVLTLAFLVAARRGNLKLASLFLQGEVLKDQKDEDDYTALMWAAQYGNEKMTSLLIKSGVNINVPCCYRLDPLMDETARGETTPLMAAVQEGRETIVKLLIAAGAQVNLKDEKERTALMLACAGTSSQIVLGLLQAGAELDAQDSNGTTALMIAAANGKIAFVDLLLKSGARSDLLDKSSRSALSFAESKKLYYLLGEFVDKDASDIFQHASIQLPENKDYDTIIQLLHKESGKNVPERSKRYDEEKNKPAQKLCKDQVCQ